MTLEEDRNLIFYHTSSRQKRPTNLIFRPGTSNSWAELGIAWLFQRDLDYMEQKPRSTKKTDIDESIRPVPMYDVVQAVITIGQNGSSRDNLLAHHCVQPIIHCNKSDGAYMWYLSHLTEYGSLDGDKAETSSVDALTPSNELFFHCSIGFGHLDDVRNTVQQLIVNITRAMFANGAIRLDDIWAGIYSPLRQCNTNELLGMCMGYTLFYLISNYLMYTILEFLDRQDQILDILQSYFRHAATYNPDTADASCTTYFSKAGMDFIYDLASIASKLEPTSPLSLDMSIFSNPWHRTFEPSMMTQKQAPHLIICSLPHSLMFFGFSISNQTQLHRKPVEISSLPYCSTANTSFRGRTLKTDFTTQTILGGHLTKPGPNSLVRPERLILSSLPLHKSHPQISNLLRSKNSTPHLVMQLSRFCTTFMYLSVPLQRRTMSKGQCTTSGLGEISTVEDIGTEINGLEVWAT